MSHLHIPDGIIPVYWFVLGIILAGVMLGISIYKIRGEDKTRLLPRLGLISAFVMAAMSVPLGILPYHLNLTVLVGIVLGPWAGFISIFIVNLLLSLVAHGGITVVGLNTLNVGAQVFIGYYLFRWLAGRFRSNYAAFAATFLTIMISTSLMVAVVGLSQVNPAAFMEEEIGHETAAVHEENEGGAAEVVSLERFASVVFPIASLGAVIEAFAIAVIIKFLAAVRPEMVSCELSGGENRKAGTNILEQENET